MIVLSRKMRTAISAVVAAAAKQGQLVQVYAEAEKIRRANIADNVALKAAIKIVRDGKFPDWDSLIFS